MLDDPVKLLKHTGTGSLNSVLKLFIDIFSRKKAANIFYTTDNKVLIDIVVRQLTDLCAGNPVSIRQRSQSVVVYYDISLLFLVTSLLLRAVSRYNAAH